LAAVSLWAPLSLQDAPIILARLQMLFALHKVVAEAKDPLVSLPIIELPSLPSALWWTHQDDMHLLIGTFRCAWPICRCGLRSRSVAIAQPLHRRCVAVA
jgi:hypothetical protein